LIECNQIALFELDPRDLASNVVRKAAARLGIIRYGNETWRDPRRGQR